MRIKLHTSTLCDFKHIFKSTYLSIFVLSILLVSSMNSALFAKESAVVANRNEVDFSIEAPIKIKGRVLGGDDNSGLPGVTILIKGTNNGTATDVDGYYALEVPSSESILVFSFVGYVTLERQVGSNSVIDVTLAPDFTALQEVLIVGYGEQKKETVVGSVTQTNSDVLMRTAGTPNLTNALTGNLPGLITTASTSMPGQENPQIVIRGNNSWNNNAPLILVDGVERPEFFNTMDVGSVESISVLKDASATAVFGSRGANGVIIVTTKRGRTGKAEITARFNTTLKVVSKLPGVKDAYDAIGVRNEAIEYELSENPDSWKDIIPQQEREKYRNPANAKEAERYPNIDWQDEMFKNYAMAYNANVGIRGGNEFAKYFANIDFQSEQDLFKSINNDRGYQPGYNYNRLNFRNNLDFQLSPTTKLSTNLGGSYGVRKSPWGGGDAYPFWVAAYSNSPDGIYPRYSDGTWGYNDQNTKVGQNSLRTLSVSGVEYTTTAQLSTNFVLDQDLSMLVKGLSIKGTLAIDNTFIETGRGVNDLYNALQEKWINPETGVDKYKSPYDASTRFDFFDQGASWSPASGEITTWGGNARKTFYQIQLNYTKTIAEKHNLTLMGLMNRQEWATGDEVPHYREDWVFRTTYNYDRKYMVEYNGAYNGSERFAPEYRFAYFSSGGLGWMLSEEGFMKSISAIDMFKIRGSYGEVGDDSGGATGANRFAFQNQWAYSTRSKLGTFGWRSEESPYTWYQQSSLGNPSVRWETVYKYNLGSDFSFLDGMITGNVDFFRDDRKDILIQGNGRAVPSYFGAEAPIANLGKMRTQGYEFKLGANHKLDNGLNLYIDFAMTHAKDKIIKRDDPFLLEDYKKQAGFQLGQARTSISSGYYSTWDDLYASTVHNTNDDTKIPGNYHIIDYNGDGIIDNLDNAPYGYSGTPQNTFNTNIGFDYKGFSFFVQFYGVNNVSRQVVFTSLDGANRVYDQGSYWSETNTNADTPMPRWKSLQSYADGSRYFYDGSYLRLKNVEVAYTFKTAWVKKMGIQSLRVYLNGNNLFLWTKMPDDRESNFAGTGWASQGAYPTVKRINFGFNVSL
jgi:TonB-linked SusC/RagA family outer membrane protein